MGFGFKIIAEGDYACFTRPEMKVERVSYDVPTPGAIEGMLKSIYWKPAIRWVIDKIIIFNPINFMNIRRNEVKEKTSKRKVISMIRGSGEDASIYTKNCINQRASMILKNVKYGIEFHFELTGLKSEKENFTEQKHYNIMLRRLRNGSCFRTPCFGCSEFPVKKIELVEEFDLSKVSPLIVEAGNVDLGYMCMRLDFCDKGAPVNSNWDDPVFSDSANAIYYHPYMIDGVIDVRKYRGEQLAY